MVLQKNGIKFGITAQSSLDYTKRRLKRYIVLFVTKNKK